MHMNGNEPSGHLLCQSTIAQYLDESTDTLFTVSGDRTIRMWDLSIIKGGDKTTKLKTGRRASLTGLSSAGSDYGRVSCVGKVPVF